MKFQTYQEGFTLIELIIYIAISSFVLGALFALYGSIYQLRVKNESIAEGEQQGQQIIQIISQTVRNAANINSPTAGTAGSILSLQTYSISTDPTIFTISNGIVSIQEGIGAPMALNSPKVTVSNLVFQNLARSGTHGIVKISFTINYTNGSTKVERNFIRNFYDSAAVRGAYP